jgi:hypothetical protein
MQSLQGNVSFTFFYWIFNHIGHKVVKHNQNGHVVLDKNVINLIKKLVDMGAKCLPSLWLKFSANIGGHSIKKELHFLVGFRWTHIAKLVS